MTLQDEVYEMFDKLDEHMLVLIASSDQEVDEAFKKAKLQGKRFVLSSKDGLPQGSIRITFLASELFEDPAPEIRSLLNRQRMGEVL